MFTITLKQTGVQQQIQAANGTDARILQAMQIGLARALQFVVGLAGSEYMSGPTKTMLGVRTGRLRSALASEVEPTSDGVIGRVGDNVPYAAKWELGFNGVEQVRAHTRVIGFTGKNGAARKSFVQKTQYGKGGKAGGIVLGTFRQDIRPAHVRAGLSNFSSLQQVRAYARKLNIAPRPFLKPALAATDIGGEITKELQAI